jgi:hypothetical protein
MVRCGNVGGEGRAAEPETLRCAADNRRRRGPRLNTSISLREKWPWVRKARLTTSGRCWAQSRGRSDGRSVVSVLTKWDRVGR